eukprot:1028713-Pelagomonas_calceolata.AAC.1
MLANPPENRKQIIVTWESINIAKHAPESKELFKLRTKTSQQEHAQALSPSSILALLYIEHHQ